MLPKDHKIGKDLFLNVFKSGKTFKNRLFLLKFTQNQEKSLFSVVVSKKISKISPVRYLVKRRFYNAIKEILPQIKTGNFIFLLDKDSKNAPLTEIKQEIIRVLKENGFYFE